MPLGNELKFYCRAVHRVQQDKGQEGGVVLARILGQHAHRELGLPQKNRHWATTDWLDQMSRPENGDGGSTTTRPGRQPHLTRKGRQRQPSLKDMVTASPRGKAGGHAASPEPKYQGAASTPASTADTHTCRGGPSRHTGRQPT